MPPTAIKAMSISSLASFSPPAQFSTSSTSSRPKTHVITRPFISISPKTKVSLSTLKALAAENGVGTTVEPVEPATPQPSPLVQEKLDSSVGTNGSATAVAEEVKLQISNFEDPRWVGGTWDLKKFQKNGKTDWDAVIDAGWKANYAISLDGGIYFLFLVMGLISLFYLISQGFQ